MPSLMAIGTLSPPLSTLLLEEGVSYCNICCISYKQLSVMNLCILLQCKYMQQACNGKNCNCKKFIYKALNDA